MIFFNVKNKSTGKTEIITGQAKAMLEKTRSFSKKYEVINECDQHGRAFDYSNFLNNANAKQSINIESGSESGTEKEEIKTEAIGGTDSVIESGSEDSATAISNSKTGSEPSKIKRNNARKDK